jgi:hypothetical protein
MPKVTQSILTTTVSYFFAEMPSVMLPARPNGRPNNARRVRQMTITTTFVSQSTLPHNTTTVEVLLRSDAADARVRHTFKVDELPEDVWDDVMTAQRDTLRAVGL